jgi:uncharacterized protein
MKRQPKLDVYLDKSGDWRWRALAANGRTVADSSEGYRKKADALHGAHIAAAAILAASQVPTSRAIN